MLDDAKQTVFSKFYLTVFQVIISGPCGRASAFQSRKSWFKSCWVLCCVLEQATFIPLSTG